MIEPNSDPEWLLAMAEKEGNGIVSVGAPMPKCPWCESMDRVSTGRSDQWICKACDTAFKRDFAAEHAADLSAEIERLKIVNVKLLTACKAAILVIRETHVSGSRIELTLQAAIKAAS